MIDVSSWSISVQCKELIAFSPYVIEKIVPVTFGSWFSLPLKLTHFMRLHKLESSEWWIIHSNQSLVTIIMLKLCSSIRTTGYLVASTVWWHQARCQLGFGVGFPTKETDCKVGWAFICKETLEERLLSERLVWCIL